MNFTIAQNSNLPILKLQVVKDGIEDYNSMMEFIERSSIFFSMVDTLTGIPKIYSKTARFVEKLGMNVNASAEYYVYYRFTEQDTSRVGRYEGQFVFINDTGTLVLPIRERLYINIEESYIANDLPYNNCYVLDYNCCVTPFPSPAPTQTPYPVLSPTPTNTPTPTSSPSAIPLILGLFVTVDPGSIIINYNLVANQVVDQEVTMNFTHVLPVISGDPIVVMTGVTISINNTSGNTVVLLTENYYDLLREDLFGNVVVIPSTAQWEIFENYPTTPTPTPIPTNTPTPTVTPTPTPTNTPTPIPTNTPTPTVTPTSVIEILINPLIVGNDEYLNVGDGEYLEFVDPI